MSGSSDAGDYFLVQAPDGRRWRSSGLVPDEWKLLVMPPLPERHWALPRLEQALEHWDRKVNTMMKTREDMIQTLRIEVDARNRRVDELMAERDRLGAKMEEAITVRARLQDMLDHFEKGD